METVDGDTVQPKPTSIKGGEPLFIEVAGLSFVEFVLALKDILPQDILVDDVRGVQGGFRVRTRNPMEVAQAVKNTTTGPLASATPASISNTTRTVRVTIRSVPTEFPVEVLQEDLKAHLGHSFKGVWRLHASTEGRIDKDRPIPVIVVAVSESSLDALQTWRIHGFIRVSVAAKPRKEQQSIQCRRCYQWGHRTGTCKRLRRCVKCGATNHLAAECQKERKCLNCDGDHHVTWGGCPSKQEESRRVAEAIKRTPPRPIFSSRQVTKATSFADAVRQPEPTRPEATPRPEPTPRPTISVLQETRPEPRPPRPPTARKEDAPPAAHLRALRQRRDLLQERLDRVVAAHQERPNPTLLRKARALRKSLRYNRRERASAEKARRQQHQAEPDVDDYIQTPSEAVLPANLLHEMEKLRSAMEAFINIFSQFGFPRCL